MYEVIHYFTDLQDFNHPYNVGDTFPRDGLKVNDARISELSGNTNKQHKPLIRKVTKDEPLPFSDEEITREKKYNKTEINRMSTTELRGLADKIGIENASKRNGGELKKILIEHFNL